jgi:bifunctional DNA-binding transcriptional regulator/antitoxin component of YhaV-PrlF toxin-antitoxin module
MEAETFISRVINSGRVTLPKNLRKKYEIKAGEFVEVQFLRKIAAGTPS